MAGAVKYASAGLGVAASVAFQPVLAADEPGLPAGTMMERARPASAPITQNFTFNIVQRPGEDTDALARRVTELVRREGRLERRAGLGDWV
jgi:hypothetical protein